MSNEQRRDRLEALFPDQSHPDASGDSDLLEGETVHYATPKLDQELGQENLGWRGAISFGTSLY